MILIALDFIHFPERNNNSLSVSLELSINIQKLLINIIYNSICWLNI